MHDLRLYMRTHGIQTIDHSQHALQRQDGVHTGLTLLARMGS